MLMLFASNAETQWEAYKSSLKLQTQMRDVLVSELGCDFLHALTVLEEVSRVIQSLLPQPV